MVDELADGCWIEYATDNGIPYYYSESLNESTWDKPLKKPSSSLYSLFDDVSLKKVPPIKVEEEPMLR